MERLLDNQSEIYNVVLLAVLAATLLWEMWLPRREPVAPRVSRWRVNFLLMSIDMVVLYAVVPAGMVALALVATKAGWGLFNQVQLPLVPALAIGILLMDLARYGQHYLMHHTPLLWRIHRAHHSDPDLDVTTSLRFHPIEMIVGMITDSLTIVVFGVPALAVILYRLARVTASTVVHGNVTIPSSLDRLLRRVVVTPDMHRIHHSVLHREQIANLGGCLSWWDYLFGTYVGTPASDYGTMQLGLVDYPAVRTGSLSAALMDPFVTPPTDVEGNSASERR